MPYYLKDEKVLFIIENKLFHAPKLWGKFLTLGFLYGIQSDIINNNLNNKQNGILCYFFFQQTLEKAMVIT